MYNTCTRSFASTYLRPMADRELMEAKHQRQQKAADALESMFPGLGGVDPMSPSNLVANFRVIEKRSETGFYEYTGRYQLQRSDHSNQDYILKLWQGKNIGFSASDIRKISVAESEIVLDFDYDGFPAIEKSSD